jgi:hypothetical protein
MSNSGVNRPSMDTSFELETVVKATVAEFMFEWPDYNVYYVENEAEHVYAIVASARVQLKRSLVIFLARIERIKVFIEVDRSIAPEVPLYKALIAKGISRERIVLDYLGEQDPDKYHGF